MERAWPLGRTELLGAGSVVVIALLAAFAKGLGGALAQLGFDVVELLFQAMATDIVRFALPAGFSRLAMPASRNEHLAARAMWALVVATVALGNLHLRRLGQTGSFALVVGAQVASYLFMAGWEIGRGSRLLSAFVGTAAVMVAVDQGFLVGAAQGLCCLALAWFTWTQVATRSRRWLSFALGLVLALLSAAFISLPVVAGQPIAELLIRRVMPIRELEDAFAIVAEFCGTDRLQALTAELLIVTVHVQIPLGFLGIAFLRRAQDRMNTLLLVGEAKLTAMSFVRHAVAYVLLTAVPYMMQRTVMENVNTYAFGVLSRDLERSMRLDSFFPTGGEALLNAVSDSNFTVGGYADAFNGVVSATYGLVERKLFSLPKLALLPGMLWSKPWLVATVLPLSILLDEGKSWLGALLSNHIEELSQKIEELKNRRQQVEQHDSKHQELIRLNAVAAFERSRWRDLSLRLSDLQLRHDALASVRGFLDWLYWQDMMTPGIECTLGFLLELRHITNVDIWVYTRVVEDAIGSLLTRSRNQAELATMQTNIGRLKELRQRLVAAQARARMRCRVAPEGGSLRFQGLEFSRGASLSVTVPSLELPARRTYAVTGANGAGKSTAFALLAGCGRQSMSLPAGVELTTAGEIVLPSDDVEVITQQLYCPLFVRPIDWMLQTSSFALPEGVVRSREEDIARLSAELIFHGNTSSSQGLTPEDLRSEKEDWYGSLSGGQRVKLEFIRKVFLREDCPAVLLLDESFAPLDPRSKVVVQQKLKEFCAASLILAIHHSDAHASCVQAGGFFEGALHFANGTARLLETC